MGKGTDGVLGYGLVRKGMGSMVMKPSGIGGQAVMEGVMMKNGSRYAVAVRKADQSIEVKTEE